jgi:uncharacterized cupin superfamily protein
MTSALRGRLRGPDDAPDRGELIEPVARIGGVAVEQILSGTLDSPKDYNQAYDEWVIVLSGRAVVEVEGQRNVLVSGSWMFLPAGVQHRLVETEAGTSWLALNATG